MTSALGLGARVLCVFALLAVVLWVLKRTNGLGAGRRATPLQVLSTTRLGKSATLSVVRVHDEEYVLGVTGSGVTVVSARPRPAEQTASADRALAATIATSAPTPGQFLRGGWQVLRSRPVATNEVADDEVSAALARACAPAPAFAEDLAAALRATEPLDVPAPRTAAEDAPGPTRRRRPVRRPALRPVEEGTP